MNNTVEPEGLQCFTCERKRQKDSNATRAYMVWPKAAPGSPPFGDNVLCRLEAQKRFLLAGYEYKNPNAATQQVKRATIKKAALSAYQAASRKRSQVKARKKGGKYTRNGRDIAFDLIDPATNEVYPWFESLWDSAVLCARSGLPFGKGCRRKSIDRIDSSKGYLRGNVQIVCIQYNWAKNKYDDVTVKEMSEGMWHILHPTCLCA